MANPLAAAVAAALLGLSTASCGMMSGDRTSGAGASTVSPDTCADLPQAERDYCMKRQSGGFIGWQAVPSDPKPSPSGY